MKNFIKGFFQSETNESSKRLIAFLFSTALIVILFLFCGAIIWLLYYGKDISKIKEIVDILIYCFVGLIALLLGLTTMETLAGIFKNKN